MKTYLKDPQAVLDYSWDWAPTLVDGETISSATVVAFLMSGRKRIATDVAFELNPDAHSTSHSTTSVTCWVAGGTLHKDYELECHVVTSAGREDDDTITIHIMEK